MGSPWLMGDLTPWQTRLTLATMAPSRKLWLLSLVIAPLLTGSAIRAAEAPSQLTHAERMANSRGIVEHVRGNLGDTIMRMEAARAAHDVAKVNFIMEQLTALKGLMRIVEQSDVALQEALLREDEPAAKHEEAKLAIAIEKAAKVALEAASFVGDVEIYSGDTQVEVVINTPEGQTTYTVNFNSLFPTVIMSSRPPAASPFS